MADSSEPNHWTQLASELGATPDPSAAEPPKVQPEKTKSQSEAATGGPAVTPKPPRANVPSPPQRPPSDWSRLAEELGVRSEPSAEVAATGAVSTPTEPKAELEVPESTRTDLVPMGTEVELPAIGPESAGLSGEREEKSPGRRRRRRRSKSQKPVDTEPAKTAEEPPEVGDEAPLSEEPNEAAVADPSAGEEEESQERTKRRRRRRGSGRKKVAPRKSDEPAKSESGSEVEAEGAAADSPKESGGESSRQQPDDSATKSATTENMKEDKPSKPSGPGHRGIPSWQEAIGMIISANMESRAKRPSGSSSSRSRGGRNRGGHDKPGDKKS